MNDQILATGKPNIIITGAAGFIGSNLAQRLSQTNNVIAIDNFSTGNEKNIDLMLQNPSFEFIRHDIAQPVDLDKYPELKKFQIPVQGIQKIYHLACPTSPRNHDKYAFQIIDANTIGIKHVLDLATKYKAVFVQVSSQHVYGDYQGNDAITEDHAGCLNPIGPNSCYDEGKRIAETICHYYERQRGVNIKIVRLFTSYGPKMQINDGRAVPDFIFNAINNKDIVIHGDENSQNTFCYIEDCLDALIKVSNSDITGPVNVGHYEKYKLKDVAELVIKLAQSKSAIKYEQPEWKVFSYNIPDITRAKEELGWFPMIGLEQGLKKTIDFTKINMRLYQI